MNNVVELHIFNNYTHIVTHNYASVDKLREKLAVRVKGAHFSERYKKKLWDGKMEFLRNGKILTGLLPLVSRHLTEMGCQIYFMDMRSDPATNVHPINLNGVTLRGYQQKAVVSAIQNKRGLIAAATNAGKTVIAAGLMQALQVKVLFLTHRDELYVQTKDSLEEKLGEELGYISSDGTDISKRYTIAMVPTLQLKLGGKKAIYTEKYKELRKERTHLRSLYKEMERNPKEFDTKYEYDLNTKLENINEKIQKEDKNTTYEKVPPDKEILAYLQSVDMIIVDEAHHTVASTYEKVLLNTNAYYRIGLTGTPSLEDLTKEMKLTGLLGYPIFEISNEELIDMGVSSIPNIKMLAVRSEILASDYPSAYEFGIIKNPERNMLIARECIEFKNKGLQTLIIVNKTSHGNHLMDFLIGHGFSEDDIQYVHGKSKKSHRRKYFKKFADGELPILIASLIVQEGISMDAIGAMIFALGEKSDIRVLQCLGRALRQNKHGNKVEVRDFIDGSHERLLEHSQARLNTYNDSLSKYTHVEKLNLLDRNVW